MTPSENPDIVPGWVGGFAQSNPAFAYPNPDLSSLDMLDNLANINLLQRQQAVLWPEFSWETEPGAANPMRCYQMFAPDISRLGYTNEGRVYSIICPQQGTFSPTIGSMNVEVTVTGQRGWADESVKGFAADMTVEAKIWFSLRAQKKKMLRLLKGIFDSKKLPFPRDKAHAIVIKTHRPGTPDEPIFPLRDGTTTRFDIPDFAKHPEAWAVGNLDVQMGPIQKTGYEVVDDFNELVLDIFNMASGNMLKFGNILSWNVWFTPPGLVDQEEWSTHAERWRESIDADHGSPEGEGTAARYFDGTPFNAIEDVIKDELPKIRAFLKKHL